MYKSKVGSTQVTVTHKKTVTLMLTEIFNNGKTNNLHLQECLSPTG